MRPHVPSEDVPILDGDGNGGRAVLAAPNRIELDVAAANTLLESLDCRPWNPTTTG
jgi:hypothetical protein